MRPARRDYRSRGTAAIIAVAFHIAFLFLLTLPLRRVLVAESPAVPPMEVKFIDQPRGQHQDSDRRALAPRLTKPSVRLADSPPNVDIAIPVDILPPPQSSQMRAALPPGTRDVEADGSPSGHTEGVGDGAGPTILHQVAPTYSIASVRAHEQGTVTLRVLVGAQGEPTQVRLAGSSGFPRLDQSATDAVRRYRFSPPRQAAQPHESWTTVRVEFDLLRMPVPTSIVAFDSAIADQIAAAERSNTRLSPEILKTDEMVRRLAGTLFDTLARGGAGEAAAQRVRSTPTPIQVLARQGKLKWVRFLGFASRGFDCGAATVSVASGTSRCEIFEVLQAGGTSYWLSLVENNGKGLANVSITANADLLRSVRK